MARQQENTNLITVRRPRKGDSRIPGKFPVRRGDIGRDGRPGEAQSIQSRLDGGLELITRYQGRALRRPNFHKSVWIKALEKVGLPDLHFHDYADAQRTHGATRPLKRPGREDLPARHPRP